MAGTRREEQSERRLTQTFPFSIKKLSLCRDARRCSKEKNLVNKDVVPGVKLGRVVQARSCDREA